MKPSDNNPTANESKEFDSGSTLTLSQIASIARQRLDLPAWNYLMGAAESETTMLRNRLALDRLGFKPRVLNDVLDVDVSSSTCGYKTRLPVIIAPMGSIDMLNPDGALPLAMAAQHFGVMSYSSSVTHPDFEEIARQTTHKKVFQLYVRGDDAWTTDLVQRAADAGYVSVCVTVDLAWYSRRERDLIRGVVPTARQRMHSSSRDYQAKLSWSTIEKIQQASPIPVMLKGINTAEDAIRAVEIGCECVYLSNHGGRGLDHGRAIIDALPEVKQAIGDRAELIYDGGILRGTDVVKALCLGADTVGIGRLAGLSLAAGGMAATQRMLEILEQEIQTCIALLGVSTLAELNPSYVCAAEPVYPPSLTTALPFFKQRAWDDSGD